MDIKLRDLPGYFQTERIEAECRKRYGYGDDVGFFWEDFRVACIVKQIEEEESLSELERPFEPYNPKWIPDSCRIYGLQVIY